MAAIAATRADEGPEPAGKERPVAGRELLLGLGWLAVLGIAVYLVLRRAVGSVK